MLTVIKRRLIRCLFDSEKKYNAYIVVSIRWEGAIQNTVVQSIELQGNRCGTGKSRQNSTGTGIAKFAGAAPIVKVQLTANTGVGPVQGVPPTCLFTSLEESSMVPSGFLTAQFLQKT